MTRLAEHLGVALPTIYTMLRRGQTIRESTWIQIAQTLRDKDGALLEALVDSYLEDVASAVRSVTSQSPDANGQQKRVPAELQKKLDAIFARGSVSSMPSLLEILADLPNDPSTENYITHLIAMLSVVRGPKPRGFSDSPSA